MSGNKATDVVVRPKRQVTLPQDICDRLGIKPGDVLELSVDDATLIVKPRKTIALEALTEIQKAFSCSGITEEDLQESGRLVRQQVAGAKYGDTH